MPGIGFNIKFDQKQNFLDRAEIAEAIRRAGQDPARNNQAGATVRRFARNSMRKVKKRTTISAPGTPPRSRSPEPNLRTILYAWDNSRKRVIIGPVHLPRSVEIDTVPAAHEYGGQVAITVNKAVRVSGAKKLTTKQKRARARRIKGLKRARQKGNIIGFPKKRVQKVATYPPRPYMRPALIKALAHLTKLWENSVRSFRGRRAA